MKTRRSSVLPLPPPENRAPERHAGAARAVVLPFHRPVPSDAEVHVGSTWDELTKLALDGWSWRDPESLMRIEACILRLWPEVEREWGVRRRSDPRTRPG